MVFELVHVKYGFDGTPPQRIETPEHLGVLTLAEGKSLDDVRAAFNTKSIRMNEIVEKAEDKKPAADDKKPADDKKK